MLGPLGSRRHSDCVAPLRAKIESRKKSMWAIPRAVTIEGIHEGIHWVSSRSFARAAGQKYRSYVSSTSRTIRSTTDVLQDRVFDCRNACGGARLLVFAVLRPATSQQVSAHAAGWGCRVTLIPDKLDRASPGASVPTAHRRRQRERRRCEQTVYAGRGRYQWGVRDINLRAYTRGARRTASR